MLNLIKKIFAFLFRMDDPLGFLLHDPVIRASASTYSPELLARLGLKMDLNLSNQKVRFIGPITNRVFPEIVIWRPDNQYANTGQAVIVEAIETASTINNLFIINKWITLANSGATFNLIVPLQSRAQVQQMLQAHGVTNVHLQTYTFDPTNNNYIFNRA